jgi:hypothetical protein
MLFFANSDWQFGGETNIIFRRNNLEVSESQLSYSKTRKRIHNPTTGRYYQIRQRSSKKGTKGTIMGTWSPPAKKQKSPRSKVHKKRK